MEYTAILAKLIARNAPVDGVHSTAVDALTLIRKSAPTDPIYGLQRPALCIVAQGHKQVVVGSSVYNYDPSQYLIVSVTLPVMAQVTRASPEAPYLCLRMALDPVVLSDMILTCGLPPPRRATVPGLQVSRTTPELTDAVVRLVRLLDTPADIPALAPLALREIHYRLLKGAQSGLVQQIAVAESRVQQVTRAMTWIREHFTEPLSIEALAHVSHMSRSAFHQHFKAVTTMSPLQYQKQIRLQEARRLMVADGRDAAHAGYEVGYASATQFTRDYSRTYGQPPARDAARLRTAGRPASAAMTRAADLLNGPAI